MVAQFVDKGMVEVTKILLVGGASDKAVALRKMLDKSGLGRYELVHCQYIVEATMLELDGFGLVLLVMSDGVDGAASLAKVHQCAPTMPVVILADGSGDQEWGEVPKSFVNGYLDSRNLTSQAMESVLRTACNIHALGKELKESRMREQHERRMRLLERLSGAPQAAITTHSRVGEPLKESNFEKFTALSRQYGEILEMVLARNAPSRVISDGIRAISEELGAIKAGPNDLLDIHGQALRMKSCGVSEAHADICAEESRLTLIEAMGYLTSYYRNYSNYALSIINTVSVVSGSSRSAKTTAPVVHAAG